MNEEELADLLTQHLDTLLEGGPLPETLPPEVADLLAVAQNLTETAPRPRPEFGPALKESLLGPVVGGNGASPSSGSTFGSFPVAVVIGIGLLAGAAVILALLARIIIFPNADANDSTTPAPIQTQTMPTQPAAAPFTPTLTVEPTVTLEPTVAPTTPAVTPTPIVDVLPVITVTVEITIQPPALAPGSGGGSDNNGGGGGNEGSGGGGGDHNKGHGNDSDHDDDDNPGKGGDD